MLCRLVEKRASCSLLLLRLQMRLVPAMLLHAIGGSDAAACGINLLPSFNFNTSKTPTVPSVFALLLHSHAAVRGLPHNAEPPPAAAAGCPCGGGQIAHCQPRTLQDGAATAGRDTGMCCLTTVVYVHTFWVSHRDIGGLSND